MPDGLKQTNASNSGGSDPQQRIALRVVCVAALMLAAFGCRAPRPPLVVTDSDPGVKIPAIKKAVRQRDQSAVAQLVKDLDSDDPAVRFYSIRALHRLTGQWFDYRYYESDEERKPAVDQWKQWLAGHEKGTEQTGVAGSND